MCLRNLVLVADVAELIKHKCIHVYWGNVSIRLLIQHAQCATTAQNSQMV